MKRRRLMIRIALDLLLFVVLLGVGGYLLASYQRKHGMFFPDRYPLGDWSGQGLRSHEELTFRSADGVELNGWLFRADSPSAPLMIWFHGNAGNLTDRLPFASEFAKRGISTFVFDYRGFGKSGGAAEENALFGDALAAYDLMATRFGPAQRYVLYGESIGGPYAAWVGTQRPADSVIIENSFPSLAALGNALYRPLPLGIFAPKALTTRRWLNEGKHPVLLMHGRHDTVIPFRLAQQLYDELEVPKEMFVSERANHSEIPAVEGTKYYDAVTQFVFRHSGAK